MATNRNNEKEGIFYELLRPYYNKCKLQIPIK